MHHVKELDTFPDSSVLLPPVQWNAMFLTYHALAHFLEEGLCLKQLLDWAMFLKRDANKIDWPLFYSWCDKYHFRRFVDVATDIAVHKCGITLPNLQITDNSPFTEKVIKSTMSDDYVFNNSKGGWYNRWLILKNLFKYRWKYHLIYQHGIVRQLWFYFIGFIFKTDRFMNTNKKEIWLINKDCGPIEENGTFVRIVKQAQFFQEKGVQLCLPHRQ